MNDQTQNQHKNITMVSTQNPSSKTEARVGLTCPNCGSDLVGRKCKLVCPKPGCGYLVTCSEW